MAQRPFWTQQIPRIKHTSFPNFEEHVGCVFWDTATSTYTEHIHNPEGIISALQSD